MIAPSVDKVLSSEVSHFRRQYTEESGFFPKEERERLVTKGERRYYEELKESKE